MECAAEDRRFRAGKLTILESVGVPDTPKLRVNCVLIEGTDEFYRLACVELRGGSHPGAHSAELPGLVAWDSCHPLRPSSRGGDVYYLERLLPLPGSPYPWADRRREAR